MAWTIPSNSWVRMFARGRVLGQDIVQQRDYSALTSGTTPPESDLVLDAWLTAWATANLTWLPSDYSLVSVAMGLVTSLDSDAGPPVRAWPVFGLWEEITLAEPEAGLGTSPSLPLQVSARGRKITNGGLSTFYRLPPSNAGGTLDPEPVESRFRGRISYGPISAAAVTGADYNRLNTGSRPGIEGALEAMINLEVGDDPDQVFLQEIVVSLIKDGDFRSNTDPAQIYAAQDVQEYSVAEIVGTQDRRTPGT